MISWEAPVEAIAAGTGVSVTILTLGRRAFRRAVQDIVDRSQTDLLARQAAFERRQGQHLDRQDKRLARIEQKLDQRADRITELERRLPPPPRPPL